MKRVTAVILAGGKGSRLGQDKVGVVLGGKSLLERVAEVILPLSEEVLVVTSRKGMSPPLAWPSARLVYDIYPGKGSLGGIYTGVLEARSFYSLVVACDMPFLNASLLQYMIEVSTPFDLVVPRWNGYLEPLHAIYSRNCLEPMRELLEQGSLRLADLFARVKVRYLEEAEVARFDPLHRSFLNINTPQDFLKAQELLREQVAITGGKDD